jgi:hypothetical protein
MVKVPIRVGQIIRAFEQKATKGDVQAGRELRSWLAEYPPEDDELRPEDMPALLRQRLLARLIAEIRQKTLQTRGVRRDEAAHLVGCHLLTEEVVLALTLF